MEYSYLAKWVEENATQDKIIEKVTLENDCLLVWFKCAALLTILYKTQTPLPCFINTKEPINFTEQVTVWQELSGTILTEINIAENDRIIFFLFGKKNIYNEQEIYYLIYECMPPKPNVILCKKVNNSFLIIDALIKYSYAENPHRQILPNIVYEPPKTSFMAVKSPVEYPIVYSDVQTQLSKSFNNMNDYFKFYIENVINQSAYIKQRESVINYWKKELARLKKKRALQYAELNQAKQEQNWIIYAELLKSQLSCIRKGDENFTTINYFDPLMPEITIPLYKDKTPYENLQLYLKKYRKAKNGKEKIITQLDITNSEIDRINNIILELEQNPSCIIDYRQKKLSIGKDHLPQKDNLLRLKVNSQWEIVIGRKATENDFITTQLAKPTDWWFHTRIYHGSHVLLRNYSKLKPSIDLIELCCSLAAWFSKARHSENVPVDYTQIRYVRKPRKSAPGFVTYTNHKTLFVNPIDFQSVKNKLDKHDN